MIFDAILNILDGSLVEDQVGNLLERELHPTEKQVDLLRRHHELQITPEEMRELQRSGRYKRHFGLHPGAHFRAKRGKGAYHLRVKGDKAYLHRDDWDPRRHPVKHFFEVPKLWKPPIKSAAAGAALGALIGGAIAKKRGLPIKRMLKKAGKWGAIGGLGGLAGAVAIGSGELIRRSKRLQRRQARERTLREQQSGGGGGAPSGNGGGATGSNGTTGSGTGNGSPKTVNMEPKENGKLMGKGVLHTLHVAYRPDVCSRKHRSAKEYYECLKRKGYYG